MNEIENKIIVTEEQYEAFVKRLESPAEPNERLKALFASCSPWEKKEDASTE